LVYRSGRMQDVKLVIRGRLLYSKAIVEKWL
jgi:hypothetical protein